MDNTLEETNYFNKPNRFDLLAKEWDSKPERVESAMKFVDYIKSDIKEDISHFNVLDYGCGSGLVSFGFACDVKSIDGLDYSNEMVNRYNQKAKGLGFDHIRGENHNINIESIDNNKYNLVVTNMTMHHICDIRNFIDRLKLSLCDDGYLYIADLISEDGSFHSMGNDDVEHLGFDKDYLYEEFIKAGFTDIKFDIIQVIKKGIKEYPIFSISGKLL